MTKIPSYVYCSLLSLKNARSSLRTSGDVNVNNVAEAAAPQEEDDIKGMFGELKKKKEKEGIARRWAVELVCGDQPAAPVAEEASAAPVDDFSDIPKKRRKRRRFQSTWRTVLRCHSGGQVEPTWTQFRQCLG